MFYLGQTLLDKENNELVLYLGIVLLETKPIKDIIGPRKNLEDNLFGFSMIRRKNGRVEFVNISSGRFKPIKDRNGKYLVGRHAINEFFGLLGEYMDIIDKFPDTDLLKEMRRE